MSPTSIFEGIIRNVLRHEEEEEEEEKKLRKERAMNCLSIMGMRKESEEEGRETSTISARGFGPEEGARSTE